MDNHETKPTAMLQDLPVEVVQQIIHHLPTASSIINLSLTNQKIHAIVSADDYAVFRTFIQRAFPTIKTPPLWRDVARTLTSRSRAWDRRAFIARECYPLGDSDAFPQRFHPVYTVGYHPVIDSYEVWQGGSWSNRKEVLAWGAAGRLRTRTIKDGVTTWSSFRTPEDRRQDLDILDVRLLLPHQHENQDGESIILQRANQEIIKVETSSKPDDFTEKSRYIIPSGDLMCMDVSRNSRPLLAACDNSSIHLYPIHSFERHVRTRDTVPVEENHSKRNRKRCAKFLSDTTLAVGVQFFQGRDRAPINIYDIGPTGLSSTPLAESISFSESNHPLLGRHSANVITPLDDIGTSTRHPGQIFLSGWTDGIVRLYDTRVPRRAVAEYLDPVDDGQILSLLPIGHERFLAGSHQNGCLKTFDLRISGARAYSYLDARPQPQPQPPAPQPPSIRSVPAPRRDINIFLTPNINPGERLWQPLPHRSSRRSQRYRGSVYSLSAPSPSSPTIYAGIENHVLQLDFVSTDDYRNGLLGPADSILASDHKSTQNHVLNFSCYERPREGKESTDPVLLRKQAKLTDGRDDPDRQNGQGDCGTQSKDGWDERWRLEIYDRDRSRNLDWGAARGRRQ